MTWQTIIVNGRTVAVDTAVISFETIAELVAGDVDTITWWLKGSGCGMLSPGEFVTVREGMIFTAAATGAA